MPLSLAAVAVRRVRTVARVIAVLAVGASVAAAAPADSTLVLAADAWPPYNCAADDTLEGYMIDVARAVFEPLGYRVEYRIVPWPRALAGAREGLYAAAVGATPVEGAGLVLPATELLRSRSTFFVRAGDPWRFAGPASLDTVTVGAVRGYDYVGWLNGWLEANAERPERVQLTTGEYPLRQNLRKLLAGRVDVVVGDPGSVTYTALRLGLRDAVAPAGAVDEGIVCTIAFTPDGDRGRRLADLLDEGVARLRREGRFAAILARYGLRDWAPDGRTP